MRRMLSAAGVAALVAGLFGCGGYGKMTQSISAPTPAPAAAAIVIDVVGINGVRSFSPNPAAVRAGQTIAWHNLDTIAHRVVLDDGELDTGNIAPGAISEPMALVGPGPYHCSIHPEMVGELVPQP